MKLEGADYLWGTVGNRQIYCADAAAGRGLFYFERPKSSEKGDVCSGALLWKRLALGARGTARQPIASIA